MALHAFDGRWADYGVEMEEVAKAKIDAGALKESQYHQITYHRIEAEIWLEELEGSK